MQCAQCVSRQGFIRSVRVSAHSEQREGTEGLGIERREEKARIRAGVRASQPAFRDASLVLPRPPPRR